ncbi:MAG: ABC transporter substrate-binding protein [Candidatus Tectomicrobia bacterium]|nr:ABC transporter substrate-binding protein [Candidatus Tectomicrobia bacterium]
MKPTAKLRRTGLCLAGAATFWSLFWLCGGPPGQGVALAQEKTPLTVGMSWLWTGRHSWYFTAVEQGLYAKAGLDVKLIRGFGGGATAKNLAVNAIQFAELDAATLIKARAEGVKVKLLSIHLRKSPFAFFALRKSNIRAPKDMEGKTFGAPKFDVMRIFFPAYARLAGIDANKVNWVTFSPGSETASLLAGKIDVTTGFIDTFGGTLQAKGIDAVTFLFSDVGFTLYGSGIAASDAQVTSGAAIARKYVVATNQAVAWTARHPEEAIENLLKHHKTQDRKVMRVQLAMAVPLLGDLSKLGRMDEGEMKQTKEIVSKYMQLKKDVPLGEIYTNDFLK